MVTVFIEVWNGTLIHYNFKTSNNKYLDMLVFTRPDLMKNSYSGQNYTKNNNLTHSVVLSLNQVLAFVGVPIFFSLIFADIKASVYCSYFFF